MVLSPQCFHNLNLHSDIFNHSNVHFWEYMQPGYDTLGFISCTGKLLLQLILVPAKDDQDQHHRAAVVSCSVETFACNLKIDFL